MQLPMHTHVRSRFKTAICTVLWPRQNTVILVWAYRYISQLPKLNAYQPFKTFFNRRSWLTSPESYEREISSIQLGYFD